MGLFDSVYVPCKGCGEMVEFQSKAGECFMASYTLDNAPNAVKGDVMDRTETCEKCRRSTTIHGKFMLWAD